MREFTDEDDRKFAQEGPPMTATRKPAAKTPRKTTKELAAEFPQVEFDETGAVMWPFPAPRHGVRGL